MDRSVAEKKMKVAEFLEIEVEPNLSYELINGEIVKKSMKHDRGDKMKIYREHQVREYWIVDPKNQSIEVYQYQSSDYDLVSFAVEEGEVVSHVLKGFTLEVSSLFSEAGR